MFRGVASKLALVLLLLIAATVGATLLIIHDLWFYGILTAAVACLLLGGVFRLYRSNTRKITFMFNAIENNDYAFPVHPLRQFAFGRPVQPVALNRIKELLVKAKNEAIEREKYYELILERIITGIVVVNERGSVMQTNSEALRLLGLSVFTHLSQLDRVEEGLTEKFRALEVGEGTRVTLHHERGEVNLALQASEVTIRGTRLRIIAVNDIDRELDDKELESWIRLTRVLTHEIMNAVTPVMSLSDTLLRLHGNRDDDTYRGLEAIHATSKSLISFVESYRSFTRIPAPEMELLDVRKFLERIVMLVSRQIEEQHIRVDIRVEPEDLILYADGNQITQVILNLLKNAAGAIGTREGGVIALSAFCNDEEHVIVDVANNGEPISEEVSQHIFVPFFTTKEHGSGIGLSVSRQIMRLHRGSLKLQHSTPRETRFRLVFR